MPSENNNKTYKYIGLAVAVTLVLGLLYKLLIWLAVI